MTIFDAVILGLIQGLTEFLPVSSSGHLVLGQHLLNIQNADVLAFDVYVHFGTLISVCVIFRRDIRDILLALWTMVRSGNWKAAYRDNEHVRLASAILIGSIPAAIVGLKFHDEIEQAFSDPKLVAVNLIITGLILFVTRLSRPVEGRRPGPWSALIIGFAQAVAILPGISRSGSTISTAMYLRLSPSLAARFSFLLAIPVIGGAALLETKAMVQQGMESGFAPFAIGLAVSALTGYLAIKLLLRLIERGKFSLFAYYCFALGIAGILLI